jgi:threonine/homoserine/homoserine lactone efflux protein
MAAMVFLGAALLVALTPGANNLLALQHGVRHGRWMAILAVTGRLAAFVLMIGAVVAGLGPLLASSERALTVIRWAGVVYLVWLGSRTLRDTVRGRRHTGTDGVQSDQTAPRAGGLALIRKEFLVAITNPKALLVFTAFVPQFIHPGRAAAPQLSVLGLLYLVAEAVAGSGYCVLGGVLRTVRMTWRARRRLDRATGLTLLGVAGVLAFERP